MHEEDHLPDGPGEGVFDHAALGNDDQEDHMPEDHEQEVEAQRQADLKSRNKGKEKQRVFNTSDVLKLRKIKIDGNSGSHIDLYYISRWVNTTVDRSRHGLVVTVSWQEYSKRS